MANTTAQPSLFDTTSASRVAYDDVPYISHPFPQTNPLLLQGIAKLFGLTAADPKKARVLEIGCASGSNILSVASNFPHSICVGIDYSEKQIAAGKAEVEALGITNLELKHLSVMDVSKSFGSFDYIICHGVLSWVAPEVQEKILEVCAQNLSKDGIAFVSYNTLPGWNSVRSVREMMLYHTARFDDAATKANQARLLLKFVGDAMKANNNPMASFLERELALLMPQPDYYLLHDHMEENNVPLYFHEVMSRADQCGLQYLADSSLDTMFSGNFSVEIAQVLATTNDLVRTEQYMDFITNRRFRNTLLCHKDRILNRNIQPDVLKGGRVISGFAYPEHFDTHDIASKQPLQFKAQNNMVLTSDDPFCLALLRVLMEAGRTPLAVDSLPALVTDMLKQANVALSDGELQPLDHKIGLLLLRFIFMGALGFLCEPYPCVFTVSKKPHISKLARYQAARQHWVSGLRQESLTIELFDKFLIPYIDGTRDAAALLKSMLPHFASKELVMSDNGVAIEDEAVLKERLVPIIADKLQRYAAIGLFEK